VVDNYQGDGEYQVINGKYEKIEWTKVNKGTELLFINKKNIMHYCIIFLHFSSTF
jgi:hypothetical protein